MVEIKTMVMFQSTIVYGYPADNTFRKGSIVFREPMKNTEPFQVRDFELGEVNGKLYLLADKPREEFLGTVLSKSGQPVKYFRKDGRVIQRDEVGNDIAVIGVGVLTDRGRVLDVSDTLVVVTDGAQTRTMKKSIVVIVDDEAVTKQNLFDAAEEMRRIHDEMYGNLPKRFNIGNLLKGFSFSPIGENQHNEGEVRDFGNGDWRILARGPSQKLRWMDKKELESHGFHQLAAKLETHSGSKPAGSPAKKYRVGEKTHSGGEEVEVVSHSDNIVAFKRKDGSTGTFDVNDHKESKERSVSEPTQQKPNVSEQAEPEIAGQEHLEEQKRQEGLQYQPSGQADHDEYRREAERIREEAIATPEYQDFLKTTKGWTKFSDEMTFNKVVSMREGNISISGYELQKMWMPEQKRSSLTVNGRAFSFSYNGKNHELVDILDNNFEQLSLRDPDSGKTFNVDRAELDKFRGQIRIDDDGNAFVVQGNKVLGEFAKAEGITQDDLMKPGIVKIINDEVWKRIEVAEGAKFNDVKLGRIETGVVAFKHGDEVGMIDSSMRTHVTSRKQTRRNVPRQQMEKNLEAVRQRVNEMQRKLSGENAEQKDLRMAKAAHEIAGVEAKTEKKQPRLIASKYSDVLETFAKSGSDVPARIADSYGTPEWQSNVKMMAALMRTADEERAREAEEFNAMSKSGILKDASKVRNIEDYMDTADELLRGHRQEQLRERLREKVTAVRAGAQKSKFEWDETAETPATAKEVQGEPFRIRDSKGNSYSVQYAIVPMADVVQSHDVTGKESSDHPAELQARKRSDPHSVTQMQKIASDINDDVVTDNADATRGAPVAFSKGGKSYIVQGNGRTAGIKGTEGPQRERYLGMLVQKAKALNLPTDRITADDMLIRVMTDKHTYEDARRLAAFGQESAALPYTEVESARAYQNAQRSAFEFGVNLSGIGNRAIDESNIGTFTRNNPQLYKRMLDDSGYAREAIEAHPSIQARLVNTAILSQLRPGFVEDVASRDEKTHLIVKRIAPSLIDNQKDIADGKLPKSVDLQEFLSRVIKGYDQLDSSTRSMMNIRAGQIEFLNDDPNALNPNTLLHRMKQEDLLSTEGNEQNVFRDPLHVIGMIAYNQAVQATGDGTADQQSATKFALKIRRFADALKSLGADEAEGDIFGAIKSDDEKAKEQRDRIVAIAERVLMENKPYRPGAEQLTAEEQSAATEQLSSFGVHKRMRKIAESYGFNLFEEKPPLAKGLRKWMLTLLPSKKNPMIKRWQEGRKERHAGQKKDVQEHKAKKTLTDYIGSIRSYVNRSPSKEELFSKLPNKLRPIGTIEPELAKLLGVADPQVYSGEAYFLNHHFNHHPDNTPEHYETLPTVLSDPDERRKDDRGGKEGTIVLLKKYDKYHVVVVEVGVKGGKILLHKTFFTQTKKPYKNLPLIGLNTLSGVGGVSTISRESETHPAGTFSARPEDNTNIQQNNTPVKKAISYLKSVFPGLFKSGQQIDLFAPPKTNPESPKPLTSKLSGVSWRATGAEKPGHKYLRRYKGKSGEWEYVYPVPGSHGTKEYVGDAEGNELPRHRDWKAGDKIHVGDHTAHLVEAGDNVVTIEDESGKRTVDISSVEHEDEKQIRLIGERAKTISKYKSLVDELEADLEQGEKSGHYEFADGKNELLRKIKAAKEEHERRSDNKGTSMPNQTERVKQEVQSGPKTAGEIAKATGILEPNVRRILGVGAKSGQFERVAEGVYSLKSGKETITVINGDARKSLPKLVEEGYKSDMVFLDIPYKTPAVTGGNRGVKYDTITPEDFGTLLDSVTKCVEDDSPVIHMFSQAKSGMKAMSKYNAEILKRFKPIARGFYAKTFKDGSPATNMRGDKMPPEIILLLSKSGKLTNKTIADADLEFTFVKPKGYTSEKPQQLLENLIDLTTFEGAMVLDPFAGSGVTGAAARKKGRSAVLMELSEDAVKNFIIPRVEKENPPDGNTEKQQTKIISKSNIRFTNFSLQAVRHIPDQESPMSMPSNGDSIPASE